MARPPLRRALSNRPPPVRQPAAVLAPSDLWQSPGPADEVEASAAPVDVRVGGRLLATREREITLADAFSTVDVTLAAADPSLVPGDLVVVAGELQRARLENGRVQARIPAPKRTHGGAETARFAHGDVGRALAARAAAVRAIRSYFDERHFLEVDTPALVPCPGLDVHLDAFEVPAGPGAPSYLSTSPELQMKRLLAGGVPRCFQIGHCFRKGERGPRHNPEFSMLEWYRAFADAPEVMDDTEQVVRAVAEAIDGVTRVELEGRTVDLSAPFERIAVSDAFARFASVDADRAIELASTDETAFFRILIERIEPALAREGRPVFLVDWPAPLASLARLSPRDPRVCERFELYVGGVELCNGFGELTDPAEQRARFDRDRAERERRGLPVYPLDERFLAALDEGMPPAAGNALGVDRLVAVCLGGIDVQAVQAFPIGVL